MDSGNKKLFALVGGIVIFVVLSLVVTGAFRSEPARATAPTQPAVADAESMLPDQEAAPERGATSPVSGRPGSGRLADQQATEQDELALQGTSAVAKKKKAAKRKKNRSRRRRGAEEEEEQDKVRKKADVPPSSVFQGDS